MKTKQEPQLDETEKKIINVVEKANLIYKRVILGAIIIVLLVLIIIDIVILKQTIQSKNYPEATAVYVDKKNNDEMSVFDEYIYTFEDKEGNQQELIVSMSSYSEPKREFKIKYNKDNPQDYYDEDELMNKSEFIWFIVEILFMISLTALFCNTKLLKKMNLSTKIKRK